MIETDYKGQNWDNPGPKIIKDLLKKARTIAIVGLSSNKSRPAYGVASFLKQRGYRIIPVNPKETEILEEMAYPDLNTIPDKIDLVDLFRRSKFAHDIVLDAIKIGIPAVWLQENVISLKAFETGEANGLLMIMNRCIAKEHKRLM